MNNYEPELMYALDSLGEYSDWKNVYNVSGDDVCYCPICLGRVKLWNGQNPDKIYQKQRCFHHIDGMCSQESRVHFAYKTWLLGEDSKFKVNDTIYEVKKAKIEQSFTTQFGTYRPDITIETVDGKIFYTEIKYTNKKTSDYIMKWDELGNDVIEIDVNEQLSTAMSDDIPQFKLIYDSDSGQCLIRDYISSDFYDVIAECKTRWTREELIERKIQWEKLDWFWREIQNYYINQDNGENVVSAFKNVSPKDQRFICSRLTGVKHKIIRKILEHNFAEDKDIEKVKLKDISEEIRKLNKKFGYSTTQCKPYLCRKGRYVVFYDSNYYGSTWKSINSFNTVKELQDFFYPIMKKKYEEHFERLERIRIENEKIKRIKQHCIPSFRKISSKIINAKNKAWGISSFNITSNRNKYELYFTISLFDWTTSVFID